MITKINISQYRKLKDVVLNFDNGLNVISGTNGTCKTSILHLFSNSFQAVTTKSNWLKDRNSLSVINAINSLTNPKIESLTRGDKLYNDPAYGVKGNLFEVDYITGRQLSFRRHNSSLSEGYRYAVKPQYAKGSGDKLPHCPVVYLGLSRLVPFGEYQDDCSISNIKKKLPFTYQSEIGELYKSFTNYSITYGNQQQMGSIKTRLDFTSDKEGIDSNTISAGEDNLSIILTALISLKYYYESISSNRDIESVLLIDEIDATLHPSYQIKLLNLLIEFSEKYKIQIVFTTHSLSLLEKVFDYKKNVVYLVDNISSAILMEEPDIYKIKMHLQSLTEDDIYMDKTIPLFTEDAEARYLLQIIFSYFSDNYESFSLVQRFFHFVNASISAENLKSIFMDSKLLRTTMKSICVIDGDHSTDLSNCIIALPGKKAPEAFLIDYAQDLYNSDSTFWVGKIIISKNLGKHFFNERILKPINEFDIKYKKMKEDKVSTKGVTREFYKDLFNNNIVFFEMLFKYWLNDPVNKTEVETFYKNMHILYKKVSTYNEISPNLWN